MRLPCALPHRLDGMAGSCGSRIRTRRNSRKPLHHVRAADRCLPAFGVSSRTPTQKAVRSWQGTHPTSRPALHRRRNRRLPLRLCLSRHRRGRLHPAVGQRHPPERHPSVCRFAEHVVAPRKRLPHRCGRRRQPPWRDGRHSQLLPGRLPRTLRTRRSRGRGFCPDGHQCLHRRVWLRRVSPRDGALHLRGLPGRCGSPARRGGTVLPLSRHALRASRLWAALPQPLCLCAAAPGRSACVWTYA